MQEKHKEEFRLFGYNLKTHRIQCNLTIRQLSAITGIPKRLLRQAEQGVITEKFNSVHLHYLALALHTTPSTLLPIKIEPNS